jgi:hypothetical protein
MPEEQVLSSQNPLVKEDIIGILKFRVALTHESFQEHVLRTKTAVLCFYRIGQKNRTFPKNRG